jgi:hypothetical protein
MNRQATKSFWEMTEAERTESIKQFDKEFVIDTFRPLTPAERAQWNRMKRKPGRPQIGKGAAVVSVSIERDLLSRADRLAKKLKVSRARLISEGLRHVLAGASPSAPTAAPRRARRKTA